jgi:hypothetical protein
VNVPPLKVRLAFVVDPVLTVRLLLLFAIVHEPPVPVTAVMLPTLIAAPKVNVRALVVLTRLALLGEVSPDVQFTQVVFPPFPFVAVFQMEVVVSQVKLEAVPNPLAALSGP